MHCVVRGSLWEGDRNYRRLCMCEPRILGKINVCFLSVALRKWHEDESVLSLLVLVFWVLGSLSRRVYSFIHSLIYLISQGLRTKCQLVRHASQCWVWSSKTELLPLWILWLIVKTNIRCVENRGRAWGQDAGWGTVGSYDIESGQRKPPWGGNRGPERSKEPMQLWRTEGSSRDSVHKTLKVKWAWWVWDQKDCVAGRKNEKWSERRGRGQSIVLWTWGHCTIPRAVWEDRPLEALGQLSNDHSGCCVEMRVEGARNGGREKMS